MLAGSTPPADDVAVDADDVSWAASASFRVYGARIGLRVTDARALPMLVERLPPGSEPSPDEDAEHVYSLVSGDDHAVLEGRALLARSHDLDEVLRIFQAEIKLYIAEHAPERIFVHAGVVEWEGRAIVIPGRTHAGKSTLVHALCDAGARYYSDEFGVFRPDGRVEAYLQPLNLRREGREVPVPVEALTGGSAPRPPLTVDRVLFCRFRANRRSGSLEPISRGAAVLEFLRHTAAARSSPERSLQTLSRVVQNARRLEIGVRGDAASFAAAVLAGGEITSRRRAR